MMSKFSIPYGRQNITQEDIDAVVHVLKSDFLTQGPAIDAFEQAFAKYVGATYAVAVSNATAALHLSALALGVNTSSNIICTPITFAATANSIRYTGGNVVFCDIDPKSILLDIHKVRNLLENSPRGKFQGIMLVDFAGYPLNLEAYRNLANEFGLWIIEDACHAPGGYFVDSKGEKQFCGNGKFADLTVFSFHPVKHIASGEGGMITTNNKELYEKLLMLRTHGITKDPTNIKENHGGWYYEMLHLGYNYRMTDILAALGHSQLRRADMGLERRSAIANKYNLAFANTNIKIIIPPIDVRHAYHLYVIQVKNRKELYDRLRENGIFAQVHYIPVHTLSYYKNLGYEKGSCKLAETYYNHCLSLPIFPTLTEIEQDFVIECVLKWAR